MKCEICPSDTRVLRTDGAIRRRECLTCHHRFSTEERSKEKLSVLDMALAKVADVSELVAQALKATR